MKYEALKEAKNVEIGGRTFAVSKIPALRALPIYEVVSTKIVTNGLMGITQLPEATMKAILQFVCVMNEDGTWGGFDTDQKINDCFKEYKTLVAVILEMVKVNFAFLVDGTLPSLLEGVMGQAADSAS